MEWLFLLGVACDDGGGPLDRGAGLTRRPDLCVLDEICRPVPRSKRGSGVCGSKRM